LLNYWALKRYAKCPAWYYYQYELMGKPNVNDNKKRFYAGIAAAQKELHTTLVNTGMTPTEQQLLEIYQKYWPYQSEADRGLDLTGNFKGEAMEAETTFADFFRQRGAKIIQDVTQHYAANSQTVNLPVKVEFDSLHSVQLKHTQISFKIDRVETFGDGSIQLIHTRVGRFTSPEKLDDDTETYRLLTLYELAYLQQATQAPRKVILEIIGQQGQQQLVATKAAKKASEYIKWRRGETKLEGLLGMLDKSGQGIQAGKFEPKPGDQCHRCPFYSLICPASPE
jgi:hypothetical protein